MDPAPVITPSSDERFWSRLRDRVDGILEDKKPEHTCGVESERGKRSREDSLLLIRGLDSVASSLSQLTNTLSAAQQGVSYLAKPTPTKEPQRGTQTTQEEDIQPKAKRHCFSNEHYGSGSDKQEDNGSDNLPNKIDGSISDTHEGTGSDKLRDRNEVAGPIELKEDKRILVDVKNLAISMASKAASFARELRTIKSDLCFIQERCTLLEEENRRLREGMEKGVRPEEDDLVRLQLEALLAEKSRLGNENANLTRENQCLHQIVEYHQLTSQDFLLSYEDMHGTRLDFSSPLERIDSDADVDDGGCGLGEAPCTPSTDGSGRTSSPDEHNEEPQE